MTKSCRYLASARALRATDGFNGAVVELCFSAIERTLEGHLLRITSADLTDFYDHETVYIRASDQGVFERGTAERLQNLYRRNRTGHYYGGFVPTQQKADAMFELAERIHRYVAGQLIDGPVCRCS